MAGWPQVLFFSENQSHFHKNGFSFRLVLKQRHKAIRNWPISTVVLNMSRLGFILLKVEVKPSAEVAAESEEDSEESEESEEESDSDDEEEESDSEEESDDEDSKTETVRERIEV